MSLTDILYILLFCAAAVSILGLFALIKICCDNASKRKRQSSRIGQSHYYGSSGFSRSDSYHHHAPNTDFTPIALGGTLNDYQNNNFHTVNESSNYTGGGDNCANTGGGDNSATCNTGGDTSATCDTGGDTGGGTCDSGGGGDTGGSCDTGGGGDTGGSCDAGGGTTD